MKHIIAIMCILTSISLLGFCEGGAHAAQNKDYWIDSDREVLTFIGDPTSLKTVVVKFKTSRKQKIRLIHKKSGPGLYAFNLYGLYVMDSNGKETVIRLQGMFVAKKRWLRTTNWKPKTSLKHKTKPKYDENNIVLW